jgi:hypothetical protein
MVHEPGVSGRPPDVDLLDVIEDALTGWPEREPKDPHTMALEVRAEILAAGFEVRRP